MSNPTYGPYPGDHGPTEDGMAALKRHMAAPFDRSAAIARVGFLMPGLTDAGLAEALRCVEVMALHHGRDLTPATLAVEQRAREAEGWRMRLDLVDARKGPCACSADARRSDADEVLRGVASGEDGVMR